jgi:hypothetical protein
VILRSLAGNSAWGLGLDLGLQYDLSSALTLGVTATDITSSFISYDNGTKESILPSVKLGGVYSYRHRGSPPELSPDGEFYLRAATRRRNFAWHNIIGRSLGRRVSLREPRVFRAGSDIGRLTLIARWVGFNFPSDAAFGPQDLDK